MDVGKDDTKDDTKEKRQAIVEVLRQNPKLSIDDISKMLKLSRSTILRGINKLKNSNKIKRIGGRKDGYWEIQ